MATMQASITVFKIKNRSGYAAVCDDHLTEGKSEAEALDRMAKALDRTHRQQLEGKGQGS